MARYLSLAVILTLSAPAISSARGKSSVPKVQLRRAVRAISAAIQKGRPLRRFMAARVTVVYHTSDRSEGTFDGKKVVAAAALDGAIAVTGKTGGYAWAISKKIKPRAKTVRFDLRRAGREILKNIREYNRTSLDKTSLRRPALDVKKLTGLIDDNSAGLTLRFRRQGKRLLVSEIKYSVEDPG